MFIRAYVYNICNFRFEGICVRSNSFKLICGISYHKKENNALNRK